MNDWLYILFHPSYWIQIKTFSPTWDAELRRLLDLGERFKAIGEYYATIGGHEVWIENHPYASFSIGLYRPSRATIRKAHERLLASAGCRSHFELQEFFVKKKLEWPRHEYMDGVVTGPEFGCDCFPPGTVRR